jgi:hypothetical protein
VGSVAQRVERGVKSPLPASGGFMVRLSGDEPDQFLQFVVRGGQDGPLAVGADPVHQSFAVGV